MAWVLAERERGYFFDGNVDWESGNDVAGHVCSCGLLFKRSAVECRASAHPGMTDYGSLSLPSPTSKTN